VEDFEGYGNDSIHALIGVGSKVQVTINAPEGAAVGAENVWLVVKQITLGPAGLPTYEAEMHSAPLSLSLPERGETIEVPWDAVRDVVLPDGRWTYLGAYWQARAARDPEDEQAASFAKHLEPRDHECEDCAAAGLEESQEFLSRVWSLIEYWGEQGENQRDALEGLAFSMLNQLDEYGEPDPGRRYELHSMLRTSKPGYDLADDLQRIAADLSPQARSELYAAHGIPEPVESADGPQNGGGAS
jgi:hypothetical protein